MGHTDPDGRSRWHRLRITDGTDVGLVVLAALGLLLTVVHAIGGLVALLGGLSVVFGPLVILHGSTPVFFFLALGLFLSRRGRSIGTRRRWVWGGFALTIPLWFLVGLPISVRGAGDITGLVLPWNLVAVVVMAIGPYRTLSSDGAAATP